MESLQKTKEYIAEKYFDGIKIKYLKYFEAKTPQGNKIEGLICKKANRFLGSMVILRIHTLIHTYYDVEQFVHAMPKIHYWDRFHSMFEESEVEYYCYEKLDGSCLILYGLYIDGELIEVVPKTRGVPVADSHIIEMYNDLDHLNIQEFFKQCKGLNPTLLFELYGTLNMHAIFYPKVRIDIALIGASFEGVLCIDSEIDYIAFQYDFDRPKKYFTLKKRDGVWIVVPHRLAYLIDDRDEIKEIIKEYPTQYDAITAIKDCITKINKNYAKVHKQSLLEGVCVNTFDSTGDHMMYLKIKSTDIEEKCRTQEGIPRKIILKEVYKYFDEYGSQAKEIYKEDDQHAYKYIMNNLSEEFDKEALENKKTKNRVKNVFLDVLEAKQPPKGLQEICRKLVEEYPGQTTVDYIRLFAQQYPEKKRQAQTAFSIFESLV